MKQHGTNEFIRALVEDQREDGSFLNYSAPVTGQLDREANIRRTTFVPALIATTLARAQNKELGQVRRKAAMWLLSQRGPQWSFNYWARETAEAKMQPYPDDWDCISCAVTGLTLARPQSVTSEALAHIVTLLTSTEIDEGGPYRTWIVSPDAPKHWHDVDIAVNSNIAYMLRLHGVDLPNLERLADERIAEGPLSSPYYPSSYPVEYFVSRWYRGEQRGRLLEQILTRRKAGRWGNPLDTALAVSACLNLEAKPTAVAKAVEWLRAMDKADIRPYAFCFDPAIDGVKYVAGSRALTAAFCLEAVVKYDEAVQAPKTPAKPADGRAERIHEQVVAGTMDRFKQGGTNIQAAAEKISDRLLGGTAGGQITLLPYLFRRALGENGRTIDDEQVVAWGMLSFYGWVAYTIYDDFLDEEGQPTLLPVANVALRELVLALHREAERTRGFGAVAWPALDQQEAANAWEVRSCRVRRQSELLQVLPPDFGDRGVLAERSAGHALGCVAMTMELGHTAGSAEVRAVQEFFRHFLIARQLGDDIHDWKADLQAGQINAVGAYLLQNAERRTLTVRELYTQLERIFWERGATEVNNWILRELALARAALKAAEFIQRPEVLEVLLTPIEEATHQSQQQQRQTAEFLQAYNPEKLT